MADSKITALTALTAADPINDVIPIVDVSDTSMAASGTTKKISVNNLLSSSPTASGALTVTGLVTAGSASVTGALDAARLNVTGATIPANGVYLGSANNLSFSAASTLGMTLNANGLGVGVVPSAWGTYKALQVTNASLWGAVNNAYVGANYYFDGSNRKYIANGFASEYSQVSGAHAWFNAVSGTAGNPITFTQAMTLDASGNLLVGSTATATAGVVFKVTGAVANGKSFEVYGTASGVNPAFYCPGSGAVNGVATGAMSLGVVVVNKDSGNLRSISAAGSLNASGADYAEYMTKSGDFVIAKGDVAGIDANGKLTNVFADAVSFVVKSTDPSYVGNDKWGVDLEGSALESARQLVDRIAFAGQVPVNVTGANAGDYIVPVVDGTAIKGIAVSNPTFDQYKIAVGKVITIDTDGRARIIVKVA